MTEQNSWETPSKQPVFTSPIILQSWGPELAGHLPHVTQQGRADLVKAEKGGFLEVLRGQEEGQLCRSQWGEGTPCQGGCWAPALGASSRHHLYMPSLPFLCAGWQ